MKLTTLVVISTEYHTIMAMTYPIHICLSTTILWYFVSIFFVIVDKYILLHEILLIVCKNGFLRSISQRSSLRFEMRWEVYFEKNMSMIVWLSRICQSYLNITSQRYTLEINDTISYHACCLIIYTLTKDKHHPIFLSIYFFTSILLKQSNRYHC
jgi:hypothetical protein